MDEELKTILKYLRLGDVPAYWDELLAEAEQGRFSHERLLKHLFKTVYRLKSELPGFAAANGPTFPKYWKSRHFLSIASQGSTACE